MLFRFRFAVVLMPDSVGQMFRIDDCCPAPRCRLVPPPVIAPGGFEGVTGAGGDETARPRAPKTTNGKCGMRPRDGNGIDATGKGGKDQRGAGSILNADQMQNSRRRRADIFYRRRGNERGSSSGRRKPTQLLSNRISQ